MVAKMKKDSEIQGASLDEISIFRSQQLDLVTVPIKLRALNKGFWTARRDLAEYHDNSWWESFGGGHAKEAVQTWLLFVFSTMCLACVVGLAQLGINYFRDTGWQDMLFPVAFGVGQSLINIWVLWAPLVYILQGGKGCPRPTLRYINLFVLVVILIAVTIYLMP